MLLSLLWIGFWGSLVSHLTCIFVLWLIYSYTSKNEKEAMVWSTSKSSAWMLLLTFEQQSNLLVLNCLSKVPVLYLAQITVLAGIVQEPSL
jgi:uncharacterized membrane protein